jgi:hypothetical protein
VASPQELRSGVAAPGVRDELHESRSRHRRSGLGGGAFDEDGDQKHLEGTEGGKPDQKNADRYGGSLAKANNQVMAR